jgi:hypothetical protein
MDKIYRFVTMVYRYNCHSSGHSPLSCLLFKTQSFGYWILSPSTGGTYSVGPNPETETSTIRGQ